MKSKTCGECREYVSATSSCRYLETRATSGDDACEFFAVLTNGDRIRQMNDDELAEFIHEVNHEKFICDYCIDCGKFCLFHHGNDACTKGMIAWLNAPASCGERDKSVGGYESSK